MINILTGDCREVLKNIAANSVDSCVTDPPYGLTSIIKRFGKKGSTKAQYGKDGSFQRLSRGFMGKKWDGSGVEYDMQLWQEVFRVLKPGGHLLAFGGSRTYHRIAVAIEDAGFEIRDQIQWIYGSGFPKSHNQSGNWKGWGTALKPANEPICLARKPLTGTVTNNLAVWGTGTLNIDACRIESGAPVPINRLESWSGFGEVKQPDYQQELSTKGRWPANVIFDDEAAHILNEQSGKLKTGAKHGIYKGWGDDRYIYGGSKQYFHHSEASFGGASRFFYVAKASKTERNAGLYGIEPKQKGGDRNEDFDTIQSRLHGSIKKINHHPTVKPITLMRYLCRLITPPGGTVLDMFMGSGSTGCAAVLEGFNFIGIDLDTEYVEIAKRRIAYWKNLRQPSLLE